MNYLSAPTRTARTPSLRATGDALFPQPARQDLTIYRGDTCRLTVSVSDPDGVPADISAATWDADIRATVDAATALASFAIDEIDASTIGLTLSATASAALVVANAVWDLEMTMSGEVHTLLAGKVSIVADVSRT